MNWNKIAAGSLLTLALAACNDASKGTSGTASAPAIPSATITVQVDQPGAKINPAMWGAFFEDINFGADGGLYAQMVKNGTFEFPDAMTGWIMVRPTNAKGDVAILADAPYKDANPHFAHISSKGSVAMGISNEGFRGMGVIADDSYDFSVQARVLQGTPKITVEIVGSDGTTLASAPLTGITGNWSKLTTTLRPKETNAKARMAIFVEGPGTVDLDYVSLFPQKTWKNRPGGLRADMVQALADLKPGFLRFPGGCIVEGSVLSRRYQWKNTIGPVEDRPLLINRWNYEFKHRPTPDYYQSFGLGFYEFFQLAEDIGAKPLPIINCGMACQFNSGELCTPEELGNYIQDALDLIEFANGPADSTWGSKRAAMGHPAPFNVQMMGVGNEQWGPQYLERLAAFTAAIKKVHPEINLVSDSGPSPSDERFNFLWPKLNQVHADIVDQHCYANPIWFLSNSNRFDSYDRNGPKIFFGEYAAQSIAIVSTKNRNNVECALSEAAYMTGMERNADVVRMASYAPLFANIDAWQWTPNLIWTDSLHVMPTPNYYVQQLFTHNRGDEVLPVTNTAPIKDVLPTGRIGVGTSKSSAEFKDIHVTRNDSAATSLFDSNFSSNDIGWSSGDTWQATGGVYRQNDPKATVTSFAGEADWTDYTLTLKARKLAGEDGIVVTVLDNDSRQWAQWMIGGWGNSQHGIVTHYAEQDQLLERVPGSIETNRWYDIKIVVKGDHMDCYLDGQLIQSAQVLHLKVPSLFTAAAHDDKTGQTILKVVNPNAAAAATTIHLRGASAVNPTAQVITFSGANAEENSFETPDRTAPTSDQIKGVGPEFSYTFKPRSLTIFRLNTGNNQ